jgi:hypothetical protein
MRVSKSLFESFSKLKWKRAALEIWRRGSYQSAVCRIYCSSNSLSAPRLARVMLLAIPGPNKAPQFHLMPVVKEARLLCARAY